MRGVPVCVCEGCVCMVVLVQECVSVRVCVKGIKVRRSVNFGRTSAEKQIAAPRKYENEGTEQSREETREGREEEEGSQAGSPQIILKC